MGKSVGGRFLTSPGVLTGVFLVSSLLIGHLCLRTALRQDFMSSAEEQLEIQSSRVERELEIAVTHAKWAAHLLATHEIYSSESLGAMESSLYAHEGLLAIAVYRRDSLGSPIWRVLRHPDDPTRLNETDIKRLESAFPLDLKAARNGSTEIGIGFTREGRSVIRGAFPLGELVLTYETDAAKLVLAMASRPGTRSLLLSSQGRLISQSLPEVFTKGEDLSHLPIADQTRSALSDRREIEYRDLPTGPLRHGVFKRAKPSGLVFVSDFTDEALVPTLHTYWLFGGAAGLIIAAIAALVSIFQQKENPPLRITPDVSNKTENQEPSIFKKAA